MDISELKNYPHKITKIYISNVNDTASSDYESAMLQITLEKEENEMIVFSTDKEMNERVPFKKDNNNYFIYIDNVEGVSILYAHFLISDLYDYPVTEIDDAGLLVSYDLTKLKEFQGEKYHISNDEHPKISSIVDNSILENKEKDPNYKHYNKKAKGQFPIISRYAKEKKSMSMPDIAQTPFAKIEEEDANCNNMPEWEAHIHRSDIGDIIQEDTEDNQYPINVYMNYQYLPTTTDYHQHFYGFEAAKNTTNRDINVFEGENLKNINGKFFNNVNNDAEDYSYRLINCGDKFDHNNAMFVDHKNIVPIDLNNPNIYNESCEWRENICDKYYMYTPLKDTEDRGLSIDVDLKANTSYTLKYYIFIPNDIRDKVSDCSIEVGYGYEDDNGNDEYKVIGELHPAFKRQDKYITGEWVYHEIPFTTTQVHNTIRIKGHRDVDKSIYFSTMYIEEFVQYTPTIKYTNKGVFVVEDNTIVTKPNSDYSKYTDNNNTEPCPNINYVTAKEVKTDEPPTPHDMISINFSEVFDVEYNERSTYLYYYGNDYEITYEPTGESYNVNNYSYPMKAIYCNPTTEEGVLTLENDGDSLLIPPKENDEEEDGKPHHSYPIKVLKFNEDEIDMKNAFTYGVNNTIKLQVTADDNSPIKLGYAECAIVTSMSTEDNIKTESKKYLGKKYVDENGNIIFDKINLTKLERNDSNPYYLRIDYYYPCYSDTDPLIFFKHLKIIPETPAMTITVNGKSIDNNGQYHVDNIDEFPLHIEARITDKNIETNVIDYGYCELSINEEAVETSYVNVQGIADFYLNRQLHNLTSSQVIKIVHYKTYDEQTDFKYFTLTLEEGFENKDVVPIIYRVLSNDATTQTSNELTAHIDDCFIMTIEADKEKYSQYSVRLYYIENDNKVYYNFGDDNNPQTYINMTTISDDIIIPIYLDFDARQPKEVTYTIVTDSKIDNITNDEITYANDKYMKYSKSFTVKWE